MKLKSEITKILFLVNNLNFFHSHRMPIAEAAKNQSIEVIIGYGELGGADLNIFKQKGLRLKFIPIQRGGINIFKDLLTFFYIWKFFREEKPEIIHLISIKPYLYGGIIARILNIPSLVSAVSGLGALFIENNFKNYFLKFLLYPIYFFAFNHSNQAIIFQNLDDVKTLQRWGVLKPKKVKLIKGSGVNLENFKNFKYRSKIPVVCFAARLLIDKGINEFISAAKMIKDKGVKVRFIVAGSLDLKNPRSLTKKDLHKIKSENVVEYLGFQDDIAKLYEMSHIVCLPSYREGLPKSLIEAAAAARAIVTTNVPGCRDAIIPNKTGLLVPVKDINALADAILILINDINKCENMGIQGRYLAEKEFSINNVVKEHLDIYFELNNRTKS